MSKIVVFDKLKNWCLTNIGLKRHEWDDGILYAYDVLFSETYITSRYMQKQCFKVLLYLMRSIEESDFPLLYNKKRMHTLHKIWEKVFVLTDTKFKGQTFKLYPNQVFKLLGIYGFVHRSEPNKLITQYFYDVEARKQGKSEWISGTANLFAINIFGIDARAEIYFAGPKQESSDTLYVKSGQLIKHSPILVDEFEKNNRHRIESMDGGIIKSLPFEVDSAEGKNFSLAVLTEYHLHDTDEMFQSFNSAKNDTRYSQIIFFDTTKGHNIGGPAYTREKTYKKLLDDQYDNPNEVISPQIFCFIAELDDEDDIEDHSTWYKGNPMMGVTVSHAQLIEQWQVDKLNIQDRNEFITKRLGRWVGEGGSTLTEADMEETHTRWKEKYPNLDSLKGKPCFIMVDLAKSHDLNAVSLLFKDRVGDEEIAIFSSKIFIPGGTLIEKENTDKVNYSQWVSNGWAKPSGNKTVDFADIAAYINELIRTFDVKKVLYDPYQWSSVQNELVRTYKLKEYIFEEVKQNHQTLSSPLNIGLKKIFDKQFVWFGETHVKWQFLNVILSQFNGAPYFAKNKQVKKIDSFATYVVGMKEWENLPVISTGLEKGVKVWTFK